MWSDAWPDALAWSVAMLAHEAQHVSGIRDEVRAECYGMQSIRAAAVELGRTPREGRYLAALYWKHSYPRDEPLCRSPDCRDGGRLDPASPERPLALSAFSLSDLGLPTSAHVFRPPGEGTPQAVRGSIVVLLIGLAVAVIVFVATSGRVVFLPLIFLPFVLVWPLRRRRDRRL